MRAVLLIAAWARGSAAFTINRARSVSWYEYSQKSLTTSASCPRYRRTASRVWSRPKDTRNELAKDSATPLPNTLTAAEDAAASLSLVSLITAFTAIQWARAAIYYCVDFSSTVSAPIHTPDITFNQIIAEGTLCVWVRSAVGSVACRASFHALAGSFLSLYFR